VDSTTATFTVELVGASCEVVTPAPPRSLRRSVWVACCRRRR
jgi:hypothetical protein